MTKEKGYSWARNYHDMSTKVSLVSSRCNLSKWNNPKPRWAKLNSDDTVSVDGASIGGVLWDTKAGWQWGYNLRFGTDSGFKVEAWALLEGLLLAWDKGFRKVEAECDSVLLVHLITSGGRAHSSLVELRLLHQVVQRQWEVPLCYIPKTLNRVADHMEKINMPSNGLLRIFHLLSSSVLHLLDDDRKQVIC